MQDYFKSLVDQVVDFFRGIDYAELTIRIFLMLLGLLVIWLVAKLVNVATTKFFKYKHKGNQRRRNTLIKVISSLIKYLKYTIMFLYILFFFNIGGTTILTGLGAAGIIFTFAFQDLSKDVVAGFFVLIENSYDVGDRVSINGVAGIVENLSLKTTTIVPYTGEKVIFNNSAVREVTNYTSVGYAVIINNIRVDFKTNIEELTNNLNNEIKNWHKNYPNVIEIAFKGVSLIGESGLEIQLDSKVLPLTQFQTKRDINLELINFVKKYHYTIALNTITLSGGGNGNNPQ